MIGSIPRPFCQKVLPLVYDNSLSYYEQLCKLVFKVNEIIDTFNDYESIINQLAQELAELNQIKAQLTSLQNDVGDIKSDISTINVGLDGLAKRDNQLQSQIDNLTRTVNNIVNQYNSIIAYVDSAMESAKLDNQQEWIDFQNSVNISLVEMSRQVRELTDLVHQIGNDVYNPIKAKRESLDENNEDIYADLKYGGMTNAERLAFGGTNEQLASKVLDNKDYALNGRFRCKMHWIISSVTGKKTPHQNAISEALELVTNGLTNSAFAELDLTNEEVAELDLTNIQKFLYNPNGQPSGVGSYIKYDENFGHGLTVEQYEGLFVGN